MVNYQNGKIYKIEDVNGEMCYIGSTTKDKLCQRMAEHRNSYTCFKNGKMRHTTVYNIFEKYGVENCRILLIELVACNTKDELASREGHYIRSIECVNKVIPDRTVKEYHITNKDVEQLRNKAYRATNKDVLHAKRAEQFTCECGSSFTHGNKTRHGQRQHHLEYIANQAVNI